MKHRTLLHTMSFISLIIIILSHGFTQNEQVPQKYLEKFEKEIRGLFAKQEYESMQEHCYDAIKYIKINPLEEDSSNILVSAHFILAYTFRVMEKGDSSIYHYQKVINIYEMEQSPTQKLETQYGLTHRNLSDYYFHIGDNSKALHHSKKELSIFSKDRKTEEFVTATKSLRRIFHRTGQIDSAIFYGLLELESRILSNISPQEAANTLGILYDELGDDDEALRFFNLAEIQSLTRNEMRFYAQAIGSQGDILFRKGMIDQAFFLYDKARDYSSLHNDSIALLSVLGKLATAYREMDDSTGYDSSYYHQMLALALPKRHYRYTSYPEYYAIAQMGLASTKAKTGKFKESLRLIDSAISFFQAKGDSIGTKSGYAHLGQIHFLMNNIDSAQHYFEKPQTNSSRPKNQVYALKLKGELLLEKDSILKGIDYLVKAKKLIEKHQMQGFYRDIYSKLAFAYGIKKEFKKAYEFQVIYDSLNNIMVGKEYSRQLAGMEKKYKATELQLELTQTRSQQSRILWLGIIIFLFLGVVFLGREFRSRLKRENLKRDNLKQKIRTVSESLEDHTMTGLFSQLRESVRLKKSHNLETFFIQVEKFFRSTFNNKGYDLISIEQEINTVNYVIRLLLEISTNPFDVKWNVPSWLIEEEFQIIPNILLPIVENAVIHGIGHQQGKIITIDFLPRENHLCIVVKDDGGGIAHEKIQQIKSEFQQRPSGLISVIERLNYATELYNISGDTFNIESAKGETIVTLRLPLYYSEA